MTILRVEGLSKSFGGLMALHDLDFEVRTGEIVGLIGPNGSGKTTTLNLITGFLKPDSGSVTFRGEDITGLPRYRASQKGIARTFQIIKPFLDFSALQNVMVGRLYGRQPVRSPKAAAKEARDLLHEVGLLEKERVLAKNLTLMERKRLELARALAAKPHLLLLDELMAGLNPAEAEGAMQLVERIRGMHIAIVVIEHIVKAILGISDRIVVLNMGEKIAEGPPEEIVQNPQVIEVFLGKARA